MQAKIEEEKRRRLPIKPVEGEGGRDVLVLCSDLANSTMAMLLPQLRHPAPRPPPPPPPPPVVGEKRRALLVDMKKAHPGQDEAVKTCWQTLLKV